MIPLQKLAKLPRSQRLRKIAKYLEETEYRLGQGAPAPEDEGYFREIILLLAADLPSAAPYLHSPALEALSLRGINSLRHLVLAETGRQTADWDFLNTQGRLDPAARHIFPGMRVYLEDIRSPYNVGAMFRTAESFGVERIYLSPLCADPLHPRAERTAMGCVAVLPWERLPGTFPTGPCFALETGGVPLGEFPFPDHAVVIAGSEELGVSPEALQAADASLGRVTIPSFGAKGSLNVSVAFGILLQAWAAALKGRESTNPAANQFKD
jgi:TrmH family RNA methyltransferase